MVTARKIRTIRNKLGLSRADFGNMLGVSGPAVGHWERGIRSPTRPTLMLLAQIERDKLSKK